MILKRLLISRSLTLARTWFKVRTQNLYAFWHLICRATTRC